VESKPTEKITVTGSSDIAVFGKKILNTFASVSLISIVVAFIALILLYGGYRFARRNKTAQPEIIRPKTPTPPQEEKKRIPVSVEQSNQENSFQVRIQKRS
jgi:hypothetical protein